uniref:Serum amyloid A protein n=1 Tax=Ornithorhynchus anatinus TaxID=9258 RepID=A0A6I8PKT7_ORNAN
VGREHVCYFCCIVLFQVLSTVLFHSVISSLSPGSWDMWRAYRDMREANYKNSDKYFHARGNYDAARRGPGGIWASEVISNGREFFQGGSSGRGVEDSRADQEANRHGRSGGDPNRYRPAGLDKKY